MRNAMNKYTFDMREVEANHLRKKLKIAMDALENIMDVARVSEGVEFYAMLSEKALAEIESES
jgi:hypothetical protein